ncbi:CHAT domain-containing protein [Leptolyngbya sp. CCNP1308]|nr:CHAT domain-containing protein [Leptolyngbya sp. CCNP1308]
MRSLLSILFLASLTLTLWGGHGLLLGGISAEAVTPAQLVQEGVTLYQAGDYQSAVDRWQTALQTFPTDTEVADRTLVYENLARAYQQLGQPSAALEAWATAIDLHRRGGNTMQVGRSLTEQAQVHLSLGQHRRAIALLCLPKAEISVDDCEPSSALPIALAAKDTLGQAAALGSLGEAYRLQGDYAEAQAFLEQGLALTQAAGYSQFEVPMQNSLGSISSRQAQVEFRRAEGVRDIGLDDKVFVEEAQGYEATAQQQFEQALEIAQRQSNLSGEFQTRLNLLPLYRRQENTAAISATRDRLGALIDQLPPSREASYGAIALGRSYQPLGKAFGCVSSDSETESQKWLKRGAAIATQINDQRAESFALGELGHLAECQSDFGQALSLTQQAQIAATQDLDSADSLYLWQWQAGRIYRQQGQSDRALATYNQAVATLDSIRTEILTANQDVQFDFRDTVDPIYRELIELQLAGVPDSQRVATKQLPEQPEASSPLEAALVTADALRLAELQNYFGNDCILSPVVQARVDLLAESTGTAVISSVIFPDRTALIANIPDQPSRLVWIDNTQQLQTTIIEFRKGLEDRATEPYDTTLAEQLYAQIIAPLEANLQSAGINTLVFIHDGFLRSVPMATLHDGSQFLIEKYAIATTPALTLTAPTGLRPENLQALVLGSSQRLVVDETTFRALPSVPDEIKLVVEALPGSQVFLDAEFSQRQLQQALQTSDYPILHLATHGLFSPDPKDNFIITGQGEKVTFGQLESFIRVGNPNKQQIDLVMLTACETAIGDNRATLGLAGVAIRAGARSAIASLWQADDQTTAQITGDFYRFLRDPTLNKAQALQQAQIQAIRGRSGGENDKSNEGTIPSKWAPLVLVGNWL